MMKIDIVQMLVNLQKSGVRVHLTEDGLKMFLKLMQENFTPGKSIVENVG